MTEDTRIAFIGGTGPEGLGLATRFAKAGHLVYIGSRTEERANEAVEKVKESVPDGHVFGGLNDEGVEKADIVFITVPSDAHRDTLEQFKDNLAGKILVDVVVPMVFDRDGPKAIVVEEGSAAEEAQTLVPEAKVVSGFHHLDASQLQRLDKPMQGDVIICSDDRSAKNTVLSLVEDIEYVRGVDGGALSNSKYIEQLTVLLIHINKIYKTHSGVRITGF